ncbi:MAG: hypothetical protein IPL99_15990 [Candidatus Competibacteraceae bacterium]|nr:hypothetical protein [Candidatus Competibacteraceae bacterium]MBK8753025.1 hypothetical protein [Candidatus Competibacteraceae bacterium]
MITSLSLKRGANPRVRNFTPAVTGSKHSSTQQNTVMINASSGMAIAL